MVYLGRSKDFEKQKPGAPIKREIWGTRILEFSKYGILYSVEVRARWLVLYCMRLRADKANQPMKIKRYHIVRLVPKVPC